MIFEFEFELLLYDIWCDELLFETNNKRRKSSPNLKVKYHCLVNFLWISYIVKSY